MMLQLKVTTHVKNVFPEIFYWEANVKPAHRAVEVVLPIKMELILIA